MKGIVGRVGWSAAAVLISMGVAGASNAQNLDAALDVRMDDAGPATATVTVDPARVIDVVVTSNGTLYTPLPQSAPGVFEFSGDFGPDGGCFETSAEITLDDHCAPPPPRLGDFCQDKQKILEMVLEYTGDGCAASSHDQDGRLRCSGDGVGQNDVTIVSGSGKASKKKAASGLVNASGIDIDDTFVVSNGGDKFPSETALSILDAQGSPLQEIAIHTSCSKPIDVGDQFGSLRIVEVRSTTGELYVAPQRPECSSKVRLSTTSCKCYDFVPG